MASDMLRLRMADMAGIGKHMLAPMTDGLMFGHTVPVMMAALHHEMDHNLMEA